MTLHGWAEALRSRQATLLAEEPNAAVAIVLRDLNDPEVLLIRRAQRAGDPWSGQMAFPGGKREPGDASLVQTAIRETHEEVGLTLQGADQISPLVDLPTHTGKIAVRAITFTLGDRLPPLRLQPDEVDRALWIPLSALQSGAFDTQYDFQAPQGMIRLPAYRVEAGVVWGLTYRLLQELFQARRA